MTVTLKINDIEVMVPKGSTILEAAEKAVFLFPRFVTTKG